MRVPFDLVDYIAWARENPTGAGQPDAHLEWAVTTSSPMPRQTGISKKSSMAFVLR
ncbi:MAG TPA: hypothetical protein GXX19_12985 [Syntrophomonadaceae bacterium]|nr:hypothetical protein [Syntrophomonadaceae bacterium]